MATATIDLMDQVKSLLTPDIVSKMASFVGETPAATQKALGGMVPSVIAGLANQASTSNGAQQLFRTLDSGGFTGGVLDNIGSLLTGGATTQSTISSGVSILESLFGGKLSSITDLLARFAGIRVDSASSLLALVTPLIMHVVGRQRSAFGSSPSALSTLLGEQKSALAGLLPTGLGSLLGWSPSAETVTRSVPTREDVRGAVPPAARATSWRWLLPLLILAGLALFALSWLWNRETVPPIREAAKSAFRMADVQLPGGVKISIPEGSFNYTLYQWLSTTGDTTVPKRFVFDNLNFNTGSTQLTPESGSTVDSLVAIMKAYPGTVVRLEGYTDNTGDAAANKKLSLDRADAVKAIMVTGGIADSRISTTGYGPDNPIAPNDTEEGRAKNRRTELVVEKR